MPSTICSGLPLAKADATAATFGDWKSKFRNGAAIPENPRLAFAFEIDLAPDLRDDQIRVTKKDAIGLHGHLVLMIQLAASYMGKIQFGGVHAKFFTVGPTVFFHKNGLEMFGEFFVVPAKK